VRRQGPRDVDQQSAGDKGGTCSGHGHLDVDLRRRFEVETGDRQRRVVDIEQQPGQDGNGRARGQAPGRPRYGLSQRVAFDPEPHGASIGVSPERGSLVFWFFSYWEEQSSVVIAVVDSEENLTPPSKHAGCDCGR
jgi:hypothetical protein